MGIGALGSLALWAAAGAAVLGAVRRRWSVPASRALAALLTVAVSCLTWALLSGDYTLVYVAETTRRAGGWPSRLAALWGGMEGSLLFWTWLLALATLALERTARRRGPDLVPAAVGVTSAVAAVFVLVTALWADPFARLSIPAIDGGGLTPILEHPAMLYHPPLLYAGLVACALPFALAVAGLAVGRSDRAWTGLVRRTGMAAWVLRGPPSTPSPTSPSTTPGAQHFDGAGHRFLGEVGRAGSLAEARL